MLPNKLTLQGLTVAPAIFATTLSAAARAPSAQSFDGPWSVLVFTDYGTCGGYRYGVQISNGRVFYVGSSDVDVSGRVSPRGQARVQVRQSDQSATGTGWLSQTSGGGRWSGSSPTRQCAGHWVAEWRDF
jgi:hypothetical protein